MALLPEDRGPSSLRVSDYDPKNPIHAGIMRTKNINSQIEVPRKTDKNPKIIMPVAPGMEAEPKPSTRYSSYPAKSAAKAVETRTVAPQPVKAAAAPSSKAPANARRPMSPPPAKKGMSNLEKARQREEAAKRSGLI